MILRAFLKINFISTMNRKALSLKSQRCKNEKSISSNSETWNLQSELTKYRNTSARWKMLSMRKFKFARRKEKINSWVFNRATITISSKVSLLTKSFNKTWCKEKGVSKNFRSSMIESRERMNTILMSNNTINHKFHRKRGLKWKLSWKSTALCKISVREPTMTILPFLRLPMVQVITDKTRSSSKKKLRGIGSGPEWKTRW